MVVLIQLGSSPIPLAKMLTGTPLKNLTYTVVALAGAFLIYTDINVHKATLFVMSIVCVIQHNAVLTIPVFVALIPYLLGSITAINRCKVLRS